MYLRKIHLQNIRDFENFTLDFTDEDGSARPWTIVIGANGTGKTTLLRTIAIGLTAGSDANAMLASPIGTLVTERKKSGDIELTVGDRGGRSKNRTLQTTIKTSRQRESIRRVDWDHAIASREPFVLGYGVSRVRSGESKHRGYRILDSTRTLFDYDAELAPLELTLRRIQDHLGEETYDQAMYGIKKALDLPDSMTITIGSGGGVVIRGGSIRGEMPLEGWADGYRLNLAWIIDLYGWALRADALTKDGGIQGILLLDELEQHTHPSIQMGFIPRLKGLWPKLQVVATTHSPLVLLGAEADEVVVLKRRGKHIVTAPGATSFAGYSTEDVLVDERLFDTSARRPEMIDALSSYEQLTAIPSSDRTEDDKRRLREVAQFLNAETHADASESPLLQELKALRDRYGL